jgi:hypothetical protein
MYVRHELHHNAGVMLRTAGTGSRGRHYEIQLHDVGGAHYPTGSLYSVKRSSYPKIAAREWWPFQLRVKDATCLVRINGETVLEYDKLDNLDEGPIAGAQSRALDRVQAHFRAEDLMLTRRRMIAATLAAPALRAQIGYRDYARCLPDYLSSLAAAVYSRRNQRLAALRTPADIRSYQAWARTTFTRLVGTLPERSPLNIRTLGAIERDRYRVEKLVYESRPGFFVTANLYLPKTGAGPYPGVLFQMGHSAPGKAYPLYQRCCQGLVQLGHVVLAFDPMGQGERASPVKPLLSPTREHSMAGQKMLLVGETATGAMLWDAMRSLDVLAAHPKVDPLRS